MARLIPYLMMFASGFFVALLLVRRSPESERSYRRTLEEVRGLLRGGEKSHPDVVRRIDAALRD